MYQVCRLMDESLTCKAYFLTADCVDYFDSHPEVWDTDQFRYICLYVMLFRLAIPQPFTGSGFQRNIRQFKSWTREQTKRTRERMAIKSSRYKNVLQASLILNLCFFFEDQSTRLTLISHIFAGVCLPRHWRGSMFTTTYNQKSPPASLVTDQYRSHWRMQTNNHWTLLKIAI